MEQYIYSVFDVFQRIHRKSQQQQDRRMQMIALAILNYVKFMAKEHEVDLKQYGSTKNDEPTDLNPIFEYISANKIPLYDFTKIGVNDVDVSKREDLERFVLSHIYYITQTL